MRSIHASRRLVVPWHGAALLAAMTMALVGSSARAQDLAAVLQAERDRVAVIEKIKPTVVAIFAGAATMAARAFSSARTATP